MVIRNIAAVLMGPHLRRKYNIDVQPYTEDDGRPCLILFNHQTPSDQFFVGLSFKKPIYYVASEDIFSNGWISSVLRYAVAPIPIKKNTGDARAVLTCMRVAAEGGTIAMAPEGNRTYSGRTGTMNASIVPFIRRMKLPVLLYRIEGGYGTEPRWSDKIRKGSMKSFVVRRIEREEYSEMTKDELLAAIKEGLYVDENVTGGTFKSRRSAEYMERALYVCPNCGFSKLESNKNTIKCLKCGRSAEYLSDKTFRAPDNGEKGFPFGNFGEWYDFQNSFVSALDPDEYIDEPAFTDIADLYSVALYKKKKRLEKRTSVSLYGNRVEILRGRDHEGILFTDISTVTVLGRNKLNIYTGDKVYQLKGGKRFCALKYVNFYYHALNVSRQRSITGTEQAADIQDRNTINAGDDNGEFLGL